MEDVKIILLSDDEGHYVGIGFVNEDDCYVEWCRDHTMTEGKVKELFDDNWYWRDDPYRILQGIVMEKVSDEVQIIKNRECWSAGCLYRI